mgnify:CR=1 FL=1
MIQGVVGQPAVTVRRNHAQLIHPLLAHSTRLQAANVQVAERVERPGLA